MPSLRSALEPSGPPLRGRAPQSDGIISRRLFAAQNTNRTDADSTLNSLGRGSRLGVSVIVTLKNDEIRVIKIKYGRKRLTMIGLDGMDHIATCLRESDAKDVISEKSSKVDWYSLKTGVVTMAIIMPLMILLLLFRENIASYISEIIIIGFGLYMLIFKPMTNYYGKKWRVSEVVLSLIIIGSRIVGYVAEYML